MNHKLNIVTLIAASSTFAQVNFTNPDHGAVVSYQTKEIDISNLKTLGSPYFDENFRYGQVLTNGEVSTTGNLRYNAVNSEIEIQKGENEYSAILKRNYISAKINNRLYKLFPYVDDTNKNNRIGYFVPLNEGSTKLLFKPEKKLRRGKAGSTSYDRNVPPRFIDISSYYIQIGEEPAEKIYLRKKYFYDLLGKEKTRNIIKENNLNVSDEEDAIKLIKLYNDSILAK